MYESFSNFINENNLSVYDNPEAGFPVYTIKLQLVFEIGNDKQSEQNTLLKMLPDAQTLLPKMVAFKHWTMNCDVYLLLLFCWKVKAHRSTRQQVHSSPAPAHVIPPNRSMAHMCIKLSLWWHGKLLSHNNNFIFGSYEIYNIMYILYRVWWCSPGHRIIKAN